MPSIIEAVTDALQERLSNPNKPWAKRLADLLVSNALSTPLQKLVPLDDALEAVRHGLIDYVRSESSLESLSRVVDAQLELMKAYDAPLSELLPPQFVRALRQQALRPWSPGSRSLLKALDHEPVRELISRIIVQAVVDFSTAGRSSTRRKARKARRSARPGVRRIRGVSKVRQRRRDGLTAGYIFAAAASEGGRGANRSSNQPATPASSDPDRMPSFA